MQPGRKLVTAVIALRCCGRGRCRLRKLRGDQPKFLDFCQKAIRMNAFRIT